MKKKIIEYIPLTVALIILAICVALIVSRSGHERWNIEGPQPGDYVNLSEEDAALLEAGCTLPPWSKAELVTPRP